MTLIRSRITRDNKKLYGCQHYVKRLKVAFGGSIKFSPDGEKVFPPVENCGKTTHRALAIECTHFLYTFESDLSSGELLTPLSLGSFPTSIFVRTRRRGGAGSQIKFANFVRFADFFSRARRYFPAVIKYIGRGRDYPKAALWEICFRFRDCARL